MSKFALSEMNALIPIAQGYTFFFQPYVEFWSFSQKREHIQKQIIETCKQESISCLSASGVDQQKKEVLVVWVFFLIALSLSLSSVPLLCLTQNTQPGDWEG